MRKPSALAHRREAKVPRHISFAEVHDGDQHESGPEAAPGGDDERQCVRFGMVKAGHVYEQQRDLAQKEADRACEHRWADTSASSLLGTVSSKDAGRVIRLEALRSGLLDEALGLRCERCGAVLDVGVVAKIMRPNKGTPSLRNGVRCVGTICSNSSDESDESDEESTASKRSNASDKVAAD